MRLPKRYLKKVVKKRLIEFILMFSVISIVLFGTYMVVARSGTGILYKFDDNWFIDSGYRNNYSYFSSFLRVKNPDSFPHVLIPENNGTKVYYIRYTRDPMLAILGPPHSVTFFYIDPVPIFLIKQSILCICIAVSSVVVFTYIYLNRKRIQFTNKLLG